MNKYVHSETRNIVSKIVEVAHIVDILRSTKDRNHVSGLHSRHEYLMDQLKELTLEGLYRIKDLTHQIQMKTNVDYHREEADIVSFFVEYLEKGLYKSMFEV